MTGRRKKYLLIILGVILALILAGAGGALLWQKWTPAQIGDKYRLEDLEPGQAVLAIESFDSFLVVDNQGKWKYVVPREEWDDETKQWFRRYKYYPHLELYELLLENNKLPYGKGRVPKKLLEWAVNIETVALERVTKKDERPKDGASCSIDYTTTDTYWGVTGVGEERKEVLLREEERNPYATKVIARSDDIRIAMMCNTLDLLMGGERAERKKHFFIGIGIAFVLLLALIAGTWFWRRRVRRNREETEQA